MIELPKARKEREKRMARTKYVKPDELDCILMALMPPNRLAATVALQTGLRIGDVLSLKTEQLKNGRFSIRESKTQKRRSFTLGKKLSDELLSIAGKIYIFENRLDYRKPRTRQAVYKDIRRAAELLRLPKGISTHSIRKNYAVTKYRACGDMKKVQKLLNHGDEAITMIYALADSLRGVK